jgi:hypothetical protein
MNGKRKCRGLCDLYLIGKYDFVWGSDVLIKNWNDSESSLLPTYKELIAAGLRIWVFR